MDKDVERIEYEKINQKTREKYNLINDVEISLMQSVNRKR